MAQRSYEEEIDAVKGDLAALREDIRSLAAAFSENTRANIGNAVNSARQYGRQGVDAAEGQITEHPFASVGIAFGVGLLIGRLLNGR